MAHYQRIYGNLFKMWWDFYIFFLELFRIISLSIDDTAIILTSSAYFLFNEGMLFSPREEKVHEEPKFDTLSFSSDCQFGDSLGVGNKLLLVISFYSCAGLSFILSCFILVHSSLVIYSFGMLQISFQKFCSSSIDGGVLTSIAFPVLL